MPFSDPMDRYQQFKLDKADWTHDQELPPGYTFVAKGDREEEKALLQSEFPHWDIPFYRKMPGMYEWAIYYVTYEDRLVALAYSSDVNDEGLEGYWQIHYVVVAPEHRGKKLLPAIVTEMFRRDPEAKGGFFQVDREGHQKMYERWGGTLEGERAKEPPAPRGGLRSKLGAIRRKLVRSR